MFEREFPPLLSEQKIQAAAAFLSMELSARYANRSGIVATCALKDKNGVTLGEGAGKGINSKVGAMAESIEHFALDNYSCRDLVGFPVREIRHQQLLTMDGILANLPDSSELIDCIEMTDAQQGRIVWLPAVLQLPHDYLINKIKEKPRLSFLRRYSTNSGVAFGCSENEAVLHGLNEVIERHILSKVLMSLCGQHERLLLASPRREILDEVFARSAEIRSQAEGMKILITKTIYGVYFCMAIPKRPDGRYPMCPIGSGCSMDARIAIERAVTELTQSLELFDQSEMEGDLKAYALIRRSVNLHPLISLEILRNIDYVFKRLDPPQRVSVSDQIDSITAKIASTGLVVLRRAFLEFGNGCAVVQVYIPGLERFNLVRAGLPVVPQHLLHAKKFFA